MVVQRVALLPHDFRIPSSILSLYDCGVYHVHMSILWVVQFPPKKMHVGGLTMLNCLCVCECVCAWCFVMDWRPI